MPMLDAHRVTLHNSEVIPGEPKTVMHVLMIDNYDSFTFNLVHYLGAAGAKLTIKRNDAITADQVAAMAPDAIVLSPGPCTPSEAGICIPLIERFSATVPMLGVCLGHQAMGQAMGGKVIRIAPMHGKLSTIHHTGQSVFRGINNSFQATRYHSLVVERETAPADIVVTAETTDGLIMGLMHKDRPMHGVQFHPESIRSEHGQRMIGNFLELAREWHGPTRKAA
jgi:anthranilate synthase component II